MCVGGGVGGLFIYIYFLSKIPETVSKTKDMGLSVLHGGKGYEPNTCMRHEAGFGKDPKVTRGQNLDPLKPEVTTNVDSLVLTSMLEVIKVKFVLCEEAELNWLQVTYKQRWWFLFLFFSSVKIETTFAAWFLQL